MCSSVLVLLYLSIELMPPTVVLAGASAMGSSPLFAALDLLFRRYNITTVNELAILLRQDGNGNGAADHLTGSNNRQAAYKKRRLGSEASPAPTTQARRRACRLQPRGQRSAAS